MVGAKFCEGACVGDDVGLGVVGAAVGLRVGENVGLALVGFTVGVRVGDDVGLLVGTRGTVGL